MKTDRYSPELRALGEKLNGLDPDEPVNDPEIFRMMTEMIERTRKQSGDILSVQVGAEGYELDLTALLDYFKEKSQRLTAIYPLPLFLYI